MPELFAAKPSTEIRFSIDKSYLRGALWIGALAVLVCLPGPADAQDLSAQDKAVNDIVRFGSPTGAAPTEWLGATPHFVMVGAFKDYRFDIDVHDIARVENFELFAKREYAPREDGKLAYVDFEVAVNLVTDGIERGFEFEFENADFSAHTLPATFTLKDAEFPPGAFSNMELQIEWEWVEKSLIVNEEQLVTEGTLAVALEEGTPVADGTTPSGLIGGFVTGTYDGRPLAISFTAPVTEAEIDD